MVMLSLALGVQRENFLVLWVSLELNLIGFLVLAHRDGTSREFLFKYFLIQSVGSAILLLSALLRRVGARVEIAALISLLLKLGAAPFHP